MSTPTTPLGQYPPSGEYYAPPQYQPPQPNFQPKHQLNAWAKIGIAVAGLVVLGGVISGVSHSNSGGSNPSASAVSIVQSDGYNTSYQDDTASIAPSFAGEIATSADGLDANGNGEQCWVLTPSTNASAFEASALALSQENFPDATGSVSGQVVRVDIPALDNPSL